MNRANPTSAVASAALALVSTLLLAVSPPASATPPSPAEVIARAKAAAPGRVAPTQVTYLEVPRGDAPPRVLLRITLGPDGQLREDLQDLGPGGATVARVWTASGRDLDAAPAWLRLLTGHPLERVLESMGLDASRTSLAREGRELLWVLGAGPQAPDAPQIHVAAATGQLRRVTERAPDPEGAEVDAGPAFTVHLSAPRVFVVAADDHDADAGGAEPPAPIEVSSAPWPERITFPRPGLSPLVLALHRTTTDAALDPELFVDEAAAPEAVATPRGAAIAPSAGAPDPDDDPPPRDVDRSDAPSVPALAPLDP